MVKTLLPLHMTGALRPEVAAQVDEHLLSCAACRMIAAELRANQPSVEEPDNETTHRTSLPQPLEAYRQSARLANARAEVASAAAIASTPEPRPLVQSQDARKPDAATPQRPLSTRGRERVTQRHEPRRSVDHAPRDSAATARPRLEQGALRSPIGVAQKVFTLLMVVLALVMGLAWRGAGLRLEAYQQELMGSAVGELQANFSQIEAQLQKPEGTVTLPLLSKESLAMSLLLKAEPLHQESYLPLIDAYGQIQQALRLWRDEQTSAPTAVLTSFASEVGKATRELIQALEPIKSGSPSADQRTAVKQTAARLQGLAFSFIDEGIVPGGLPEAKVSEQVAFASAATLLPEGALPVNPTIVRRYHRRQGVDLWEVSFTHNLQKWQVQVDAESGQVVGMELPIPTKGEPAANEQIEQTARAYLAERVAGDGFVLFDRQEREGQVVFTAHRVQGGLRYYVDPIKVGVARYGGTITSYQRLQATLAWPEVPIYQLTAEQAGGQAASWAVGQQSAAPSSEGALGVAKHPSQQERLVWGFATTNPDEFIYVDAQTGEVWK